MEASISYGGGGKPLRWFVSQHLFTVVNIDRY